MKTNLKQNEEAEYTAAVEFIKKNKKKLKADFFNWQEYVKESLPVSVFMAGSPGAGKTEFSKSLIEPFHEKPIRIDADDIRGFFPGYHKNNSHVYQGSCSIGVEYLYDEALKRRVNLILDSTFADKNKSIDNINRSLNKGRKVIIYYVYQEPLVAWEFTQKRSLVEGRHVPKEVFVRSFFSAKDNVNYAKELFSDKIELNLIIKNIKDNHTKKFELNIDKIDYYLKMKYNPETLERQLNEITTC